MYCINHIDLVLESFGEDVVFHSQFPYKDYGLAPPPSKSSTINSNSSSSSTNNSINYNNDNKSNNNSNNNKVNNNSNNSNNNNSDINNNSSINNNNKSSRNSVTSSKTDDLGYELGEKDKKKTSIYADTVADADTDMSKAPELDTGTRTDIAEELMRTFMQMLFVFLLSLALVQYGKGIFNLEDFLDNKSIHSQDSEPSL